MSKDFDNHRRIFDRSDDLQGAAAVGAVLHVDVEDPFEKPGPTHARRFSLTLGVIGRGLGGTLCRSGNDFTAQLRVGRQHAVGQIAAKYIDVVREHCARAVVIFNPIDLHYLREERQAIVESSAELAQQAKQTKALELETVRKVDGTIVVSETECEILNREIPGANVTTIPILFSVKGNRAPFDERRDVFFLDGYQHKPDVDAVFYFVRSIWPLVKQKLPEAKFYVLGGNVTQEILALSTDDVVVAGYVEDLSHYLDRCRMSVVPLRYGAGMGGKIGTSMSYGVPCVATSIAVEGLGLKQGENILVGDTPENFAQEVVTLYTDKRLWDHLSINGLSFVEAHWSIQVGERKLTEFLGQLMGIAFCSSVSHFRNTQTANVVAQYKFSIRS